MRDKFDRSDIERTSDAHLADAITISADAALGVALALVLFAARGSIALVAFELWFV
jgi:hypothetical protein